MVLFPNAKINLGLHVIGKRRDGYHDLETVFYPISIHDALEVIQDENAREGIKISQSGVSFEGKTEENICVKAYGLLKKDFPQLPPVLMHLHKTIPVGAGLGGGSADGAFTLMVINKIFALGLSSGELENYALQLGSDCPFFIVNKPCFATGRGEFLEPVAVDLSPYKVAIVNPGIHVPTAEAFSLLTPTILSKSVKETIKQPIQTWRTDLKNDFEQVVFKKHPELETIKTKLYESGAIYSSMTGSGSTLYGIFEKQAEVRSDFPSEYFVRELVS